jgi:hypothetical protein
MSEISLSEIQELMSAGAKLYRGTGDSSATLEIPGKENVNVPADLLVILLSEGKLIRESGTGYYRLKK